MARMPPARQLVAHINEDQVGTLSEENGIWSFTYSAAWRQRADAFPLAPGLPLQDAPIQDAGTRRPVQWYFDNLLPEEAQRTLLAKSANINEADAFGLLAAYGAESAGSLTLLAADAPGNRAGELIPLTDAELQSRIEKLPSAPLSQDSPKRMSLAGAQHKLAVTLDKGVLYEPAGAAASTHILKPNHGQAAYPHTVINENFTMRVAARMGLVVPKLERRYVPAPIYLVERFDRDMSVMPTRRPHCIDACQLLNLDRTFKYSQGSMAALAELAMHCRNRPATRTRLFQWLVFNILTGNGDAHLKNLSFMVSHEGITLAPHYDLVATAVYETRAFEHDGWPDKTVLAWPVMQADRFAMLNRELLLGAGRDLSLNRDTCLRIVEKMVSTAMDAAGAAILEIEIENAALVAKQGKAIAASLAGELRCIRAIREVVIREMTQRLK
jgi:serine/threonine-protein kinase HipA